MCFVYLPCSWLQKFTMAVPNGDKVAPGQELIDEVDPEMLTIIKKEKSRQKRCLELIASENFASKAVQQALGSCFTNKYSEGMIGQRFVNILVSVFLFSGT